LRIADLLLIGDLRIADCGLRIDFRSALSDLDFHS